MAEGLIYPTYAEPVSQKLTDEQKAAIRRPLAELGELHMEVCPKCRLLDPCDLRRRIETLLDGH